MSYKITGITIEADSVCLKGVDFDLLCQTANSYEALVKEHGRLIDELTACNLARDRLRAGLLGHACHCGCNDLNPELHRQDCAYRKWASPETQAGNDGR